MGCIAVTQSWYKWNSQADFEAWHDEVRARLGYPLPSFNLDGTTSPVWTTSYTVPITVTETDVRAVVDSDDALELTPCDAPIIEPPPTPTGWMSA